MKLRREVPLIPYLVAQVIMLALKLFGVVDWSWWVIFLPVWVAIVACGAAFVLVIIALIQSEKITREEMRRWTD